MVRDPERATQPASPIERRTAIVPLVIPFVALVIAAFGVATGSLTVLCSASRSLLSSGRVRPQPLASRLSRSSRHSLTAAAPIRTTRPPETTAATTISQGTE